MQKFHDLYKRHAPTLEDFWGRRDGFQQHTRHDHIFGRPLITSSNDPIALTALDHSLQWYSTAPPVNKPPFRIQFIVREAAWEVGTPPQDLYPRNLFAGEDDWLMIQMGEWGSAHVDLCKGEAKILLTPELAREPDIVARGIVNTVLNNLVTSVGFTMLHCTGLLRDGRVLLLMAPHNTGKSTTALRLVLGSYQLLSDSQIYVSPDHEPLTVMGYPVGRAKLRRDMVPHFPQLHDLLKPEQVRDETKFVFDLRDFDARLAETRAMPVAGVDLCLLTRRDGEESRIRPATMDAVWATLMENSVFYDSEAMWLKNLETVAPLIERVRAFHLEIGRNPTHILATVRSIAIG